MRILLRGGSKIGRLGLSLALGGGLGNYVERVRKGSVTDYVGFGTKNTKLRRLTFNAADFFVMAGGVLWILSMLFPGKKKR